MFNKKIDRIYKNYFYKGYTTESSIYNVIEMIINSDLNIVSVDLSDNGDIGMKYFGGTYTFEKFVEKFENIKFDIDTISFNLDNSTSIEISINDKSIILITTDSTLDLNTMIKTNKIMK